MSSSVDSITDQHIRAYTRWVNIQLQKHSTPTVVEDVAQDFKNGQNLCALATVLTNKPIKAEKKVNPMFNNMNVAQAIKAFETDRVELFNIHSQTIADGDLKMTLGMLWQLILRYQVAMAQDDENNGKKINLNEIKNNLLALLNQYLSTLSADQVKKAASGNPTDLSTDVSGGVIRVNDFDKSWKDGVAITGLVASLSSDVDGTLDAITRAAAKQRGDGQSSSEALAHAAINEANDDYDIPQLIDAVDFVSMPDANTMLAYLSYYPEYQKSSEGREKKEKKVVESAPEPVPEPEPEKSSVDFQELEFLQEENRALLAGDSAKLAELNDTLSTTKTQLDASSLPSETDLNTRVSEHQSRVQKNIENLQLIKDAEAAKHVCEEHIREIETHKATIIAEIAKNEKQRQDALEKQEALQDIIDRLQKDLDASSETIKSKDDEIEELKAKLKAIQDQLAESEESVDNLKKKIEELEASQSDLEALKKKIDQLEEAQVKTIAELDETKGQVENLKTDVVSANQTIEDLSKEKTDLEGEIEALKEKNNELQGQVDKETKAKEDAEATVEDLKKKLAEALARIASLESGSSEDSQNKQKQIEDLQQQIEDLRKQLDQALQEVKDGEDKLQNSEKALAETKVELENSQEQVKNLGDEIDALKKALAESQEKQAATEKDLTEARDELDSANQEIEELKKKLASLQSGSSEDSQQKQDEIDELKKKLAEAQNQVKETTNQLETTSENLATTSSERDSLADECEELRRKVAALTERVEQLSAGSSEDSQLKQKEIDDLKERLAIAEKSLSELKDTHAETLDELAALKEKNAQLEDECQRHVAQAAETLVAFNKVNSELDSLRNELDETRSNVAVMEKDLVDKTAELQDQKNQIDEQVKQLEDKDQEIGDKNDEIEQLKKTIQDRDNEIEDLKNQLRTMESTSADAAAANARINELEKLLAAEKENVQNLEQQVSTLESEIENLKQQLADEQDKVQQLEQDKSSLEAQIEELKKQLADALQKAVAPKQESVSIGTQTDVVDFEHAPLTKKKPQTPAELEQALALEQSRVAALKEELAAIKKRFEDHLAEMTGLAVNAQDHSDLINSHVDVLENLIKTDDDMAAQMPENPYKRASRQELMNRAQKILDSMTPLAGVVIAKTSQELPGQAAVRVMRVHPGKPAAEAGLLPGEEIEQVNGVDTPTNATFSKRLAEVAIMGDLISLQVVSTKSNGHKMVRNLQIEIGSRDLDCARIRELKRMAAGVCKPEDEDMLDVVEVEVSDSQGKRAAAGMEEAEEPSYAAPLRTVTSTANVPPSNVGSPAKRRVTGVGMNANTSNSAVMSTPPRKSQSSMMSSPTKTPAATPARNSLNTSTRSPGYAQPKSSSSASSSTPASSAPSSQTSRSGFLSPKASPSPAKFGFASPTKSSLANAPATGNDAKVVPRKSMTGRTPAGQSKSHGGMSSRAIEARSEHFKAVNSVYNNLEEAPALIPLLSEVESSQKEKK